MDDPGNIVGLSKGVAGAVFVADEKNMTAAGEGVRGDLNIIREGDREEGITVGKGLRANGFDSGRNDDILNGGILESFGFDGDERGGEGESVVGFADFFKGYSAG